MQVVRTICWRKRWRQFALRSLLRKLTKFHVYLVLSECLANRKILLNNRAMHILLAFPFINNCRVIISLSSITDEKALVEDQVPEEYRDSEDPQDTRPVETHSVV